MFGCAAVVTVPDVVVLPAVVANVALATVPLTLAPATALAVDANDTAPVTLAPAIDEREEPFPIKYGAEIFPVAAIFPGVDIIFVTLLNVKPAAPAKLPVPSLNCI